jgi:hypothetical protein
MQTGKDVLGDLEGDAIAVDQADMLAWFKGGLHADAG